MNQIGQMYKNNTSGKWKEMSRVSLSPCVEHVHLDILHWVMPYHLYIKVNVYIGLLHYNYCSIIQRDLLN